MWESGESSARPPAGPCTVPFFDKRNRKTDQAIDEVFKSLIISQIKGDFVYVEEGLLNLLRGCLLSMPLVLPSSAALCAHVDHYENVCADDFGWGCGWRNIQILCSFLLHERPEASEVLFNGAGFVPDIPALQRWLEIAWSKGFDNAGAELFDWKVYGTKKWIGTSECAALLRSFGIRARIVIFKARGNKLQVAQKSGSANSAEEEKVCTEFQNEKKSQNGAGKKKSPAEADAQGAWAVNCDKCGKFSRHGRKYRGFLDKDFDLCETCLEEERREDKDAAREERGQRTNMTGPAEGQSSDEVNADFECDKCGDCVIGPRYTNLRRNFNLCFKCITGEKEQTEGEGGTPECYMVMHKFPASTSTGLPDQGERAGKNVIQDDFGTIDIENDNIVSCDDVSKTKWDGNCEEDAEVLREENEILKEEQVQAKRRESRSPGEAANGFGDRRKSVVETPLRNDNDERGKAGMNYVNPKTEKTHVDHSNLIDWVWRYFTAAGRSASHRTSTLARSRVFTSKLSPIYFQHDGHCQTIVGIQREFSVTRPVENVYLLILDPSQGTMNLVSALKEKRNWKQLIRNDVQNLKDSEYQLCFADPGIAEGEELEQLKVLDFLAVAYGEKLP